MSRGYEPAATQILEMLCTQLNGTVSVTTRLKHAPFSCQQDAFEAATALGIVVGEGDNIFQADCHARVRVSVSLSMRIIPLINYCDSSCTNSVSSKHALAQCMVCSHGMLLFTNEKM